MYLSLPRSTRRGTLIEHHHIIFFPVPPLCAIFSRPDPPSLDTRVSVELPSVTLLSPSLIFFHLSSHHSLSYPGRLIPSHSLHLSYNAQGIVGIERARCELGCKYKVQSICQ